MNKNNKCVFMDNFFSSSTIFTVKFDDPEYYKTFSSGLYSDSDLGIVKETILSKLLTSLLLFDKIYIRQIDLDQLVQLIGFDDLILLFNRKILHVVFDGCSSVVIDVSKNSQHSLEMLLSLRSGQSEIDWLEQKFIVRFPNSRHLIKKLLYNIEENKLIINSLNLFDKLKNELTFDLNNNLLMSKYNITTTNIKDIADMDIRKILRLAHINSGLLYLQEIEASTIILEGGCQMVLNDKLSPLFRMHNNNPIDCISEILKLKAVPNFADLYTKDILGMRDIIHFREDFNGKLFREWIMREDYDEQEILRYLINNQNKNLNSITIKSLRFIATGIAGIVNPIIGAASAIFDSFIIDKILSGWRPQLFLDNVLKDKIDKNIKLYERNQLKEKFEKSFGIISRNEVCPCGSGKKFKKCCYLKFN